MVGSCQHDWWLGQLVALTGHHIRMHATPPRVLRTVLEMAMQVFNFLFFILLSNQAFPTHPLFLSLFVSLEKSGKLNARLRAHFDRQLETKSGLIALHFQKIFSLFSACSMIETEESNTPPLLYLFAMACEFPRPGVNH